MSATVAKVFNLNEHPRRAISTAESGRMLNDCRDLAMRRLSSALKDMSSQIEEDLFQMAEATYDREMQNVYLEVRGKAKEKWPSIEAAFARNFVEIFNEKMRGELGAAVKTVSVSSLEMKLVGEDDLTESIAMQEIAGRFKEQCDDELSMLGERVALLLGREHLKDDDNPISPEAVCEALKRACNEIEGDIKTKLVLLKQVEHHVVKSLRGVYADLNSTMVRWNVLPDLKHGYRRAVSASPSKPGAQQASADQMTAQQFGQQADGQAAPDLFTALQQLMQTQYAGASYAQAPTGANLNAVPSGTMPPSDNFAGGFFDSLTQIQRGQMPLAASGEMSGLPDFGAIGDMVNVLRQIKTSGLAQGMPQVDAITIDIVAMLFDFVFDDAKIPDPIKALVGRLQIPVLKVAMLDKSFFSSRLHPTRKLLDGISRASIGWGEQVDQDDPLYKEISRIVEAIQTGFDSDIEIFTEMLGELEAFLLAREAKSDSVAERSAELLQQRETDEIAWVIAGEAVSRRLTSDLAPGVRQFLLDHWQQVLKEFCSRHGETHHSYTSAVATMDDLVWSVTLKANSDERRKLVDTLPTLLRSLHVGLDLIGLPQEQRNQFFDVLVALHSAAVKAGLQAHGEDGLPVSEASVDAPAEPTEPPMSDMYPINPEGELFVTRITQDDMQIEEVALVGATLTNTDDDIFHIRVEQLRRGDWVEFRQEEGSATRTRLAWVSPQRTIYLFTNPQSPRALSISPEALAHQFRNGMADLVIDEPLFDRAVNGVLSSLQPA